MIYFGGPVEVDPILSLVICLLVAHAAWGVLKETVPVMLDAVPEGVRFDEVGDVIASIPGVISVHDLHVWVMSPGHSAISAHVYIDSHRSWPVILGAIRQHMKSRFNIDHVSVQPEKALRSFADGLPAGAVRSREELEQLLGKLEKTE